MTHFGLTAESDHDDGLAATSGRNLLATTYYYSYHNYHDPAAASAAAAAAGDDGAAAAAAASSGMLVFSPSVLQYPNADVAVCTNPSICCYWIDRVHVCLATSGSSDLPEHSHHSFSSHQATVEGNCTHYMLPF